MSIRNKADRIFEKLELNFQEKDFSLVALFGPPLKMFGMGLPCFLYWREEIKLQPWFFFLLIRYAWVEF